MEVIFPSEIPIFDLARVKLFLPTYAPHARTVSTISFTTDMDS